MNEAFEDWCRKAVSACLMLATVITAVPFAKAQPSELDLGFAPALDGRVNAIRVLTNGQMYIGGSFAVVNGAVRTKMARLNADGSLDPSFSVNIDGIPGQFQTTNVSVVVPQPDGRVLIGGRFMSINGVARPGFARLMPGGSLDSSFDPPLTPVFGNHPEVRRLLLQTNGQMIAAGIFGVPGKTNWNYFERFNPDGSVDTNFTLWPHVFNDVRDMVRQSDGRFVLSASVSVANPPAYYSLLCRLNADGSLDPSYNPGQNMHERLYGLALQSDDRAVVGGFVFFYGGAGRFGFGRVNIAGTLDIPYNAQGPGSDSTVWVIATQRDDKALLGGNFSTINGVFRQNLARIHADGSLDLSFNRGTGPNGDVETLAAQADGGVLIAGSFTSVDGIPRTGLARMHGGPALNVSRLGNASLVLSWPTGFVGAVVQSSTNLALGQWFPVSNLPVMSGGQMRLTNAATDPKHFFRLNQP